MIIHIYTCAPTHIFFLVDGSNLSSPETVDWLEPLQKNLGNCERKISASCTSTSFRKIVSGNFRCNFWEAQPLQKMDITSSNAGIVDLSMETVDLW